MKPIKFIIYSLLFFNFTIGLSQVSTDDLTISNNLAPLSPNNIFKTEGYYNWGGSILKSPDGKYHLFYSRWEKKYTFSGWLTHSEIAHATSDNASGPWTYVSTVLKGKRKNTWDAIAAHSPKIKFFNGKYYLYYTSTNLEDKNISDKELLNIATKGPNHPLWYKALRPNQRTGVAVSNSICGSWKRMKNPLIEPSGPISTLAINPAISKGKDDKFYLIVKGDKPNEKKFIRNQAIAISDSPTGPFTIHNKPVIDYIGAEDMSIWYDETRKRFYGVFHAHTFIGLINSIDGINWSKADDYILMLQSLKMSNGSSLNPYSIERPFIYIENKKPKVISLAVLDHNEAYSVFIPIYE
ncbi:glycoside hydrolase family protein [Flavivirga spongiicola]|uniref:Glycoside hydrolase family protein n=1 Tax=Flavivirga spongiicola TaxID=421621 RepID=A0ABU7XPZ4_9FLAO|nr:glycoside hydrolase family protein [Flavivirga sp. MEBiC05379]MDO5977606.1 glycoside hydrolase family protein [Flavivirga sp. MEBiC05379]